MQSRTSSYDHTQRAPLFFLILLPGVLALAFTFISVDAVVRITLAIAAALSLLLAASFAHLRVRDGGDHLRIAFGPLTLFRKSFAYADMLAAEAARSDFLDGWGIHWIVGRGWIYNLWGYDCVAIQMRNGRRVRIGTDDPQGLARFLVQRLAPAGAAQARR